MTRAPRTTKMRCSIRSAAAGSSAELLAGTNITIGPGLTAFEVTICDLKMRLSLSEREPRRSTVEVLHVEGDQLRRSYPEHVALHVLLRLRTVVETPPVLRRVLLRDPLG